jgi:hypothetical protein
MEGGDFFKTLYWVWTIYITWGLIAQSIIGFSILSFNTMVMGWNKDPAVKAHWAANVASITFFLLAVMCALLLWAFPVNPYQDIQLTNIAKPFM